MKNVGPITQKRLISHFQTPRKIYDATEEELKNVRGIRETTISSIINSKSLVESEKIMDRMLQNNINLLTIHDRFYPIQAKACKESPAILYYKGNLMEFQTAVAVVGSRRCTTYGRNVAEQIGEKLSSLHIPIVSGFAKGIDSYVHAACVKEDGYPIVFLGGGVDICYPKEQHRLYEKIVESGLILSQYPPGTLPKPKQFLQRNSLISAWSSEVIVVEAGKTSGALWTARFARNHGKRLLAVPNQLYVKEGVGTNQLLAQGAIPFIGIESLDAVKRMRLNNDQNLKQTLQSHPILSNLTSPTPVQKLALQLNINNEDLMNELFELELQGKVTIRGNIVKKTNTK
ncbi:DNA-processing protein DprA [Heyndrickxia vini]|uniref:DNA-protecting protein DprA n=1 Tax=Heyndrickxia vini TaxID=1476025 RepID=A0ABX7E405_9BACI|nr:DNA-processing protein DprA [Heyndrickxia vini]QQZ10202.1 DNA-protecting protein DprA [Heyndrickxia vini]